MTLHQIVYCDANPPLSVAVGPTPGSDLRRLSPRVFGHGWHRQRRWSRGADQARQGLETAHELSAVLLDKKGTITKGEPAGGRDLPEWLGGGPAAPTGGVRQAMRRTPVGEAIVKRAEHRRWDRAFAGEPTQRMRAGAQAVLRGGPIRCGHPSALRCARTCEFS